VGSRISSRRPDLSSPAGVVVDPAQDHHIGTGLGPLCLGFDVFTDHTVISGSSQVRCPQADCFEPAVGPTAYCERMTSGDPRQRNGGGLAASVLDGTLRCRTSDGTVRRFAPTALDTELLAVADAAASLGSARKEIR
jgi:hypothetical protein